MKKVARKLLGVAVVGAFLLAFAGAVAAPAQAEMICYTAPNGAPVCYDSGPPPEAPGTGGVGGGAGNNIALPPPPPPAPAPVAPPVYNRPPAPAPMPAPAPAPKAPVQQAPAPQIQAPAKNYAPSAPIGQAPAQNQAVAPAPAKDSTTVEETNPGDITPAEDSVKASEAETETKSEEKDSVTASVTPSAEPTPTSSSPAPETSEPISGIDVLRASANQPITIALLAILLIAGVVLAYHLRVLSFGRNRKNPSTNESR